MNIKSRALMIGAGVAAAIQILISICGQLVTYLTFDPALYDPNTLAANPESALGVLGATSAVSFVICCVALLTDIVGGYLYSHFHANEDPLLQMQDGLVGGAVTGMVARLISGLFGACVGLIVTPLLMADLYAQIPGGEAALAGGAIGGAFGGIFGICLGLFLGLFLGAIGGAIGASVRGRK
jgi:hypothetical protein